ACPLGEKMLGRIGRLLKEQKGAALLIDYGPSENEIGDSFQALRAHEFTDPLANPGEADLTAHVKFPALVRQVTAMGLSCHGPTPQGRFLERLGIEARAMLLSKNATEAQKKKLRGELLRLTSAEEMGTLFKALALTHGLTAAPEGFGG
ncbi:MAG: class I SAM-dependent methyltransferase, partial [Alphaproteobacteria bacterium]